MTDLREARIAEAKRRVTAADPHNEHNRILRHIAEMRMLCDLYESDWRPEPEVDAVTLAAREWMTERGYRRNDDGSAFDNTSYMAAFRAGHADALANCADVKRMDWLEGRYVGVGAPVGADPEGWKIYHGHPYAEPLRTKIDRAMEGGE